MRHKGFRCLVGALLCIAVIFLIAFNLLIFWVATGPRSLDRLTPYIAAAFESAGHGYTVKIDETSLIWDGWTHPIDIRLKHVSLVNTEGKTFSRFPEVSVGFDILSLMRGRLMPTSLRITHPVIRLIQNDDHSINFGFSEETQEAAPEAETAPLPISAVIASLAHPDPDNTLHYLHFITILDASVSVGNGHGVFFKSANTDMLFRRSHEGDLQAETHARILYSDYQSEINAELDLAHDATTATGSIVFRQLMPGALAAMFTDNKTLSGLSFPASGKITLAIGTDATLERASFVLEGGRGEIRSEQLEAPMPITSLHAEGQVSNNGSDIQFNSLRADFGGTLLTASGVASLSKDDASLRSTATVKNILASDLHRFWPPSVSPMSREWIIENITAGKIVQASVKLDIPFGDLPKPNLPKTDADATITLEGAKVRYLPEHPEVTNVKGTVHVDGVSLNADIAGADYMRDTKLTKGTLLIEDLNADNPYIKLSYEAESSARDIVRFLGLPRLKHAERLNLKEDNVTGAVKGKVSVGFNFFAAHDEKGKAEEPDVAYDIVADAKNMSAPGFMKKFDIANANGTFSVKNSGLEYKGGGEVNGATITEGTIKYLFKPENGFDTFMDITGSAPVSSLPKFNYPAFPFLGGTLGIKASMQQGDVKEAYKANIDLKSALVDLPRYGWIKPLKEPATLMLTATKDTDGVKITSFAIKGSGIDGGGSAELNKALSDFQLVEFNRLKLGNTDLNRLVYAPIGEDGLRLEISGKVADATSWMHKEKDVEPTFSFAHFPALQFKADVGQLILDKDRAFSAVKGAVNCSDTRCEDSDVSGKTSDGKPFDFRILHNPKGERQLSIHAESAGAFLKTLDIFEGMQDGDLTVTGTYDDSGAASILSGQADITEHTVKNVPVLAKMLSLASLTGFFDTLQGKGIRFVHTRAPFTLTNDVITFTGAKTHGPALGMTADGTFTFPKQIFDLKGTIVPSYTLNNVLGNVPLVGSLLTGGEGQGVFAARYSLTGPASNPNVSVNPLSILTPGFLRGLFDILDKPSQPDAKKEK